MNRGKSEERKSRTPSPQFPSPRSCPSPPIIARNAHSGVLRKRPVPQELYPDPCDHLILHAHMGTRQRPRIYENVIVTHKRNVEFYEINRNKLERMRLNFIVNIEKILSEKDNVPLTSPYLSNYVFKSIGLGDIDQHEASHILNKSRLLKRMHSYKKTLNQQQNWNRDKLLIGWYIKLQDMAARGVRQIDFKKFFDVDWENQ